MAADVSSLFRILKGYSENTQHQIIGGESEIPITRDLLGGSKELDLDLQSGEVYLQRCNSSTSSSRDPKPQHQRLVPELQDLNLPPSLSEDSFDLKLFPASEYQSVCTLDKVKSALERAERESARKRCTMSSGSSELSSPRISSSLSSSSPPPPPLVREGDPAGDGEEEKSPESLETGLVFAAGCPSCLLYLLISRANPKCPRCQTIVPFRPLKKPRIDLNASV